MSSSQTSASKGSAKLSLLLMASRRKLASACFSSAAMTASVSGTVTVLAPAGADSRAASSSQAGPVRMALTGLVQKRQQCVGRQQPAVGFPAGLVFILPLRQPLLADDHAVGNTDQF